MNDETKPGTAVEIPKRDTGLRAWLIILTIALLFLGYGFFMFFARELVAHCVTDLVEQRHGLVTLVAEGDAGAFGKRHRQPEISSTGGTAGVDGRLVGGDPAMGEAEQITNGTLDAGMFLSFPPSAQMWRVWTLLSPSVSGSSEPTRALRIIPSWVRSRPRNGASSTGYTRATT